MHWHRCPATSIIEGGLQETVTPRCSRLREISDAHEATCAWLTFCSGDGLEVSTLIGKSLCAHAWDEMWRLDNFVRARPDMTPDELRDALAEHAWVPTEEEDAEAGYPWPEAAALSAATLAAGGDSDFSVDGAVDGAPVLSADCCSMKLLGFSDCQMKARRGKARYGKKKIDAAGQATTQPSKFWVCHSKCGKLHARECAKRSNAACVGAATVPAAAAAAGAAHAAAGDTIAAASGAAATSEPASKRRRNRQLDSRASAPPASGCDGGADSADVRKRKRRQRKRSHVSFDDGDAPEEHHQRMPFIAGGTIDAREPPADHTARVSWNLKGFGKFVTIVFEAQHIDSSSVGRLQETSRSKEMFLIIILQVAWLAQAYYSDQLDIMDGEVLRFALAEFRDVLRQKWVPMAIQEVLFPGKAAQCPGRWGRGAVRDPGMIRAWQSLMAIVKGLSRDDDGAFRPGVQNLKVIQFNGTMDKTNTYVKTRENDVHYSVVRGATKMAQRSSEIWARHGTEDLFLNFVSRKGVARVTKHFREPSIANEDGSAKTKDQPRAKKERVCGVTVRGPQCTRTTMKASKRELADLDLDGDFASQLLVQIPTMHIAVGGSLKGILVKAQPYFKLMPLGTDLKAPEELVEHELEGVLRRVRRLALAELPGSGGTAKTLHKAIGVTRGIHKLLGVQIQRLHAEGRLAVSLISPAEGAGPHCLGHFEILLVEWMDGHDPGCGLHAIWMVDRTGALLKDAVGPPIPISNWAGGELHGVGVGNALRSMCNTVQSINFPGFNSFMTVTVKIVSRAGDFSWLCKADGHMPPGSDVAKPFQHPTPNGVMDSLVTGRVGLWSTDAGAAAEFQICSRLDALTWAMRVIHGVLLQTHHVAVCQPDKMWSKKEHLVQRVIKLEALCRGAAPAIAAQITDGVLTWPMASRALQRLRVKALGQRLVLCNTVLPCSIADTVEMMKASSDGLSIQLVNKMKRVIYEQGWKKLIGYRSLQLGVPRNPKSFVYMLTIAGELSGVITVGAGLPTSSAELRRCADYLRMWMFTEDAVADDRSYFAHSDPAQVEGWLSDPAAAVVQADAGPWADIAAIEQTVAMDHDRTHRIKLLVKFAAKFGVAQVARMMAAANIPADGSFDQNVRGEDFKDIVRNPLAVFPTAETSAITASIAVFMSWVMWYDTLTTRPITPADEALPRHDPESWSSDINFLTVHWFQCVTKMFEGDNTLRDPKTGFWAGPPTIDSTDAVIDGNDDGLAGLFNDEVQAPTEEAAAAARAVDEAAAEELRSLTTGLGLGDTEHDNELRLMSTQGPGSGKQRNVPLPSTRLDETKSNEDQRIIDIQWKMNDGYVCESGANNCSVGDGALSVAVLCELRDNCKDGLSGRGASRSLIGAAWQSQELAMDVVYCIFFTGCSGAEDAEWMRSIAVRTKVIEDRPTVTIEELTAGSNLTCHLTEVGAESWSMFIQSGRGHADWLMSRDLTVVNTRSTGCLGCACSRRSHGDCPCRYATPSERPNPGEQGIRAAVAGAAWKISQAAKDLICAAIETMCANAPRSARNAESRATALQRVTPEAVLHRVLISHEEKWVQPALGTAELRCGRVRDVMVKWLQDKTSSTSRVLGDLQSVLAQQQLEDCGVFFKGEKVKARFVGDVSHSIPAGTKSKATGTLGSKKNNEYRGWYRATCGGRASTEIEQQFRKLRKHNEVLYVLEYDGGGSCECVRAQFIQQLDGRAEIEEGSDEEESDDEPVAASRRMVVNTYQLRRGRQPEFNTIILVGPGGTLAKATAAKLYANDPIVVATLHGVEAVLSTLLNAVGIETHSMHMAAAARKPFLAAHNFERAIQEMSDYRGEGAVTGVVNHIDRHGGAKSPKVLTNYGLDWITRQRMVITDKEKEQAHVKKLAKVEERRLQRQAKRQVSSASSGDGRDSSDDSSSDDDFDGGAGSARNHVDRSSDSNDDCSGSEASFDRCDSDGFEHDPEQFEPDRSGSGAQATKHSADTRGAETGPLVCGDGARCQFLGVPVVAFSGEPRHKCKECNAAMHGICGTRPELDDKGNPDEGVYVCKPCAEAISI